MSYFSPYKECFVAIVGVSSLSMIITIEECMDKVPVTNVGMIYVAKCHSHHTFYIGLFYYCCLQCCHFSGNFLISGNFDKIFLLLGNICMYILQSRSNVSTKYRKIKFSSVFISGIFRTT